MRTHPYVLHQAGASLLEVMVALLLMAVGLLGMAALQASTAKYRVNVQAQAAVALLVSDLAERVRINAGAAGPGFGVYQGGGVSLYVLESSWADQAGAPPTVGKDCERTLCSAAERAGFDMALWRQRVRELLPQGAAMVQGDKALGIDVTLMWMDKEQLSETREKDGGGIAKQLRLAPVCVLDADQTMVYNCCPGQARAPAGVRCWRMSFLP
ncbi:type IV pilus modification protein PilV [Comamonas sp. GB3 AK4-5]|uniref:type IV pilus modification protein PilV n=1 Tax=Comamonas sp. GB3 AK4-5 TaxID=3231487 RepID=UPI00351EE5ED